MINSQIAVIEVSTQTHSTRKDYAGGTIQLKIFEHIQTFGWTANKKGRRWQIKIADLTLTSRDTARIKRHIRRHIA